MSFRVVKWNNSTNGRGFCHLKNVLLDTSDTRSFIINSIYDKPYMGKVYMHVQVDKASELLLEDIFSSGKAYFL
jgi:hypothetical protein